MNNIYTDDRRNDEIMNDGSATAESSLAYSEEESVAELGGGDDRADDDHVFIAQGGQEAKLTEKKGKHQQKHPRVSDFIKHQPLDDNNIMPSLPPPPPREPNYCAPTRLPTFEDPRTLM